MRRLVDHTSLRRIETKKPSVPDNCAVFAVGDVHGRLDLLVELHQEIIRKARILPQNTRKIVVYLGDYIDRGSDSAGVIDTLVAAPLPGFESIHLLGNHDLALVSFIKGEADFLRWSQRRKDGNSHEIPKHYLVSQNILNWLYENGGIETLKSYNVKIFQDPTPENIAAMRIDLLRKIPTDHLEFLENLRLSYAKGDFFFAHAGIDPNRSLKDQKPSDLLRIKEPFLESKTTYEKVIIHGHTPYQIPAVRNNRIGIDTEAYRTGVLTALMIHSGYHVGFIQANASDGRKKYGLLGG